MLIGDFIYKIYNICDLERIRMRYKSLVVFLVVFLIVVDVNIII